jgi:DNA-binding Lrp family transcriptional regulator
MAWTLEAPTSKLRLHPRAEEIPTIPPDEYDELVLDIEQRGIVVPLDVLKMRRADGRYGSQPDEAAEIIVLDGRHRLNAARALGLEIVPIREVEWTCWHDDVDDPDEGFTLDECPSHAFEYMVKAATMRRHLTTQQRKQLASTIIIEDPERSDRQVATTTGISRPTVARLRDDLEADGQVAEVATSTGTDGKAYPRVLPSVPPTPGMERRVARQAKQPASKPPAKAEPLDPNELMRGIANRAYALADELRTVNEMVTAHPEAAHRVGEVHGIVGQRDYFREAIYTLEQQADESLVDTRPADIKLVPFEAKDGPSLRQVAKQARRRLERFLEEPMTVEGKSRDFWEVLEVLAQHKDDIPLESGSLSRLLADVEVKADRYATAHDGEAVPTDEAAP